MSEQQLDNVLSQLRDVDPDVPVEELVAPESNVEETPVFEEAPVADQDISKEEVEAGGLAILDAVGTDDVKLSQEQKAMLSKLNPEAIRKLQAQFKTITKRVIASKKVATKREKKKNSNRAKNKNARKARKRNR